MSRRARFFISAIVLSLTAAGCDRLGAPSAETQAMNDAVERRLGGTDTCVVLADTASGEIRYQYGRQAICMRRLPPCATFDVANSLIGLDLGVVAPRTVYSWDGTPQPVRAWEKDADMRTAFRRSIAWWFQRLAGEVGPARYAERLKAYGYGDANASGSARAFWMGPSEGGALQISAREQAGFLHRLYAGRLPVRPQSADAVKDLLGDDAGGEGVGLAGSTGTCRSSADGVRQAGWWIGRLKEKNRDLVFAAVMEGETAPPGAEVRRRLRQAFADVGYVQPE